MSYPIIHLGGEHTVTGSCHLLQVNGVNILIDCGMAQGNDTTAQANQLLQTLDDLSWDFEYDLLYDLTAGIRFKFGHAGYILGSTFIRFEWGDPAFSVVFSGDLGASHTPILPDPAIPEPCDLLVMESTYGDHCHEHRQQRLQQFRKQAAKTQRHEDEHRGMSVNHGLTL